MQTHGQMNPVIKRLYAGKSGCSLYPPFLNQTLKNGSQAHSTHVNRHAEKSKDVNYQQQTDVFQI